MTVTLMSVGGAVKKGKEKKKTLKTPCRQSRRNLVLLSNYNSQGKKIDLDKPGGTFIFFLLKPSMSLTLRFAVLSFLSLCHAGIVLSSGGREYIWSKYPTVPTFKTKSLLRLFKEAF